MNKITCHELDLETPQISSQKQFETDPEGYSRTAAKVASGVISDALRAGFDVSKAIIVLPGISGAGVVVSTMAGHQSYDSEIELLQAAISHLQFVRSERHES